MRRLCLLLILFLCILTPASAQNQTGYPLPKTLQTITPDNAPQLSPLASIGGDLPGDLAWSPDGKTLAVGTTGGVRVYDSTDWNVPPKQFPGWKDVHFKDNINLVSGGKIIDIIGEKVISDVFNTTPSGKTAITYTDVDGHAAVVLTDIDSGAETILDTGMSGTINYLVFSPDEQFAAMKITTHTDLYPDAVPAAQLWNAKTGTLITNLELEQSYDDPIETIGFHAQGKLLVISSYYYGEDGSTITVQLWNGRTGEKFKRSHDGDIPVRFSPDDQLTAFPTWEGISLWSDHEIGLLKGEYMIPVFSPDGRMLAGYNVTSSIINLWNIDNALKLGSPDKVLAGKIINNVTFSPDGKILAANEYDNRVRVWNLETDDVEVVISNVTGTLQFSPNSQWILAKQADTSQFALWDARTGEKLMEFDENFAINPEWTFAAQGSLNVQIVALPTGGSVRYLNVIDNYLGKIGWFDANSGRVLFATQAFDVNTGQVVFRTNYLPPLVDNAFSADGQRLLTIEDPDIYDGVQGSLVSIHGIEADTLGLFTVSRGDFIAPSSTAFLTPDGKLIGYINRPSSYSGQYSSRLEFRDVETGIHIAEWMLPGEVEAMTLSHDGKWLALGSTEYYDGHIMFLDLEGDLSKKSPIIRSINHPNDGGSVVLSNLAFSPDDSHLAVEGYLPFCGDGCIYFYFVKSWDVGMLKSSSSLGDMSSTSIEAAHAPIFSRDGKLLAVTSASGFNNVLNAGALQLWDIVGNKKVVELSGDDGIAAFSPDGRLFVIHQADHTVLYDTARLKRGVIAPIATIPDQDKPVKQLAFNSDGTLLYVMSENRLWLYGVGS